MLRPAAQQQHLGPLLFCQRGNVLLELRDWIDRRLVGHGTRPATRLLPVYCERGKGAIVDMPLLRTCVCPSPLFGLKSIARRKRRAVVQLPQLFNSFERVDEGRLNALTLKVSQTLPRSGV